MEERTRTRLTELAKIEEQLQTALQQLAQRTQQAQVNLLRVQGARSELQGLLQPDEAKNDSNGDATEAAAGD